MKKKMIIGGTMLLGLLITFCSYTGVTEKPDIPEVKAMGESVPLGDPFILLHDGVYYAYGTHAADGIEVYTSKDLKRWKLHGLALNKEDSYGDKWFWAPEVYYVEEDKKFYMFYSVEEHVCVATSDSPLGPFVQDEKKPIREEKGIDTSVFFDEDGKAYLYFVRFTNGNVIWCAELKDNLKEIKEETLTQCIEAVEPWEMVFGKVAEGPSILKRDGLYKDTHFMFLTDHGGIEYGHGGVSTNEMIVPWGITGPGIRKGFKITEPNNTVNTAATILRLFDVEKPLPWTGEVLSSIFK